MNKLTKRIYTGLIGFFIGSFIGFIIVWASVIPILGFMGWDYANEYLFGHTQTIFFRAFTLIGGIIGIIISQWKN